MSLQKRVPCKILQDWISGVFGSVGWTKDEYDRTHLCFHATFAYTLLHFGYDLQAAQCHYFPNCPTNPCASAFGFSLLFLQHQPTETVARKRYQDDSVSQCAHF